MRCHTRTIAKSIYANRIPNIIFRGHTALHKAVQQKHRNICYMLVAAGASLTMRDANGLTPMMIAFQVEDNDLATYLESKLYLAQCYSFHAPGSLSLN